MFLRKSIIKRKCDCCDNLISGSVLLKENCGIFDFRNKVCQVLA